MYPRAVASARTASADSLTCASRIFGGPARAARRNQDPPAISATMHPHNPEVRTYPRSLERMPAVKQGSLWSQVHRVSFPRVCARCSVGARRSLAAQ